VPVQLVEQVAANLLRGKQFPAGDPLALAFLRLAGRLDPARHPHLNGVTADALDLALAGAGPDHAGPRLLLALLRAGEVLEQGEAEAAGPDLAALLEKVARVRPALVPAVLGCALRLLKHPALSLAERQETGRHLAPLLDAACPTDAEPADLLVRLWAELVPLG